MLGWWRKNDGFEWREYVRTTILLRRQRRKEKVAEVQAAAVAGLKQAGKAGAVAGASGASALWRASIASAASGGRGVLRGLDWFGRAPGRLATLAAPRFAALAHAISSTRLTVPLVIVGVVGLIAAAYRIGAVGELDREAIVALGLAATGLGLGALPALAGRAGPPGWLQSVRERLPALPPVPPAVTGGALAAALLAPAGWVALPALAPYAPAAMSSFIAASKPVSGRGQAISGDVLRVGDVVLRLAGVDAPERDQRCGSGRRAWKCGEAAQDALAKAVRGKLVTCTVSGSDDSGRALASCQAEGVDIADGLVRQGSAFAQSSTFARYAGAEAEARNAKRGLWKGDALRPAEWRAQRWAEAKRSAPDGCPIKGAVGNDGKVYVLPWARDYERVKVRTGRGERWFCSEQDARAAGWRSAERS